MILSPITPQDRINRTLNPVRLEILVARPTLVTQIVDLFRAINNPLERKYFAPHAFTPEYGAQIAQYNGLDIYAFASDGSRVLAYGLLRGWDEGFPIPSLGLTVHPDYRSYGIGSMMMRYLHTTAMLRKAKQIRLRVQKDNVKARALYERLKYRFVEESEEFLLGTLDLQGYDAQNYLATQRS